MHRVCRRPMLKVWADAKDWPVGECRRHDIQADAEETRPSGQARDC